MGELILVCDVGGGTTDFSLIAVSEQDGDLTLERVAVGDHILLGGDNMDLALARLLQQRLEAAGHRIDTWQLRALWHQSRLAKESLLADPSQQEKAVTLLGRGSRLIGAAITTTLTIDDVNEVLRDGFFPPGGRDPVPARQRRVGLQELGCLMRPTRPSPASRAIPLAPDRRGRDRPGDPPRDGRPTCTTHVLFNGGVMRRRPCAAGSSRCWASGAREGFDALDERHVLESEDLDHAVAAGAGTRHGTPRACIRIRSGAARTYYVGRRERDARSARNARPPQSALRRPLRMEEGSTAAIPSTSSGDVGEQAEFDFSVPRFGRPIR